MPHRSKCHRQGALVPRLADGLIVVIVDYRWVSLMTGATLDAKSAENRLVADSAECVFRPRVEFFWEGGRFRLELWHASTVGQFWWKPLISSSAALKNVTNVVAVFVVFVVCLLFVVAVFCGVFFFNFYLTAFCLFVSFL